MNQPSESTDSAANSVNDSLSPSPSPDSKLLVKSSLSALKWSYIGVVARVILQLAAQITLARFIGPAGFGVVAAATLIVAAANIVVELGLGAALVQARSIEQADIRTAFGRIMCTACVVSAILLLIADLVAGWYGDPNVAPVLRWMTLVIVFQGFGIVSASLLRRQLDIRTVQLTEVASYLIAFPVVGVLCAWLGAGQWSLVAAWVSHAFLYSVIAYANVRHEIAPRLKRNASPLTGFGLRIVLSNLTNLSNELLENLMVGRSFGTSSLGAYSVASNLVRTPVTHAVVPLAYVLFPFASRAQDDLDVMRRGYLALLWIAALAAFPIFLSVGLLAPLVVEALYGEAWVGAVPVLVPLALAMPFMAIVVLGAPILRARGQVGWEIRVSACTAVGMFVILIATSRISLPAVAWGVWLVYVLRAIGITVMTSNAIGLAPTRSLSMLRGGLFIGGLVGGILYAVDGLLGGSGALPFQRLVVAACGGAVVLPVLSLLLLRLIVPGELVTILDALLNRLPEPLRAWGNRRLRGAHAA